jgi:hypothetical protein
MSDDEQPDAYSESAADQVQEDTAPSASLYSVDGFDHAAQHHDQPSTITAATVATGVTVRATTPRAIKMIPSARSHPDLR